MRVPFVIWGLRLSGASCLIVKHACRLDKHECAAAVPSVCIGYPRIDHVGPHPCSAEDGGFVRYK